jgi:hypothetical protein
LENQCTESCYFDLAWDELGLSIGALMIAIPMAWTVTETSTHVDEVMLDQKEEVKSAKKV